MSKATRLIAAMLMTFIATVTSQSSHSAESGDASPRQAEHSDFVSASTATTRRDPTSIKLFGQIISPGHTNQSGNVASSQTSSSHYNDSPPSPVPMSKTPKWVMDNVDVEHRSKYVKLMDKMKITTNYWANKVFLNNLKPEERKAIESGDTKGIQDIIDARPHLIRHAPHLYPEHIRPTGDRLEVVSGLIHLASNYKAYLPTLKKVNKSRKRRHEVYERWNNPTKRPYWDSEHKEEDVKVIRQLMMNLHGTRSFKPHFRKKLRAISAEERIKATQGDIDALYKLGPSEKHKGKKVVQRTSATASTSGISSKKSKKQ